MKSNTTISVQHMALCGLFAALISAGAFIKITIPVQPIPMHFTLQWFFVLLAGLLLGAKLAGTSVGVYLFLGLIGVPVFASGGGPAYLLRPTFGYLLGFLFAAIAMGWLGEHFKTKKFMPLLFISVVGLFIYYGTGVLYYFVICQYLIVKEITWQILLFNCFLMTVGEDFILCILAVMASSRLRGIVTIQR